jgi:hypothetical protein
MRFVVAALAVALLLAALVPTVAAIEPITTISVGTIVSILGTVMSVLSILLDVVRYTITYTIFFAIIILIFIQFIPIVRSIDLVGLAQRILGDAYQCKPAGPKATPIDTIPRQKQT